MKPKQQRGQKVLDLYSLQKAHNNPRKYWADSTWGNVWLQIKWGLKTQSFPWDKINSIQSEEQSDDLVNNVQESVNDDNNLADSRKAFVEQLNDNENESMSQEISQDLVDATFSIGLDKTKLALSVKKNP